MSTFILGLTCMVLYAGLIFIDYKRHKQLRYRVKDLETKFDIILNLRIDIEKNTNDVKTKKKTTKKQIKEIKCCKNSKKVKSDKRN